MTFLGRAGFLLLIGFAALSDASSAAEPQKAGYALALHGGAGDNAAKLSPEERQGREATLRKGLEIGIEILERGGASLDAVEQVIRHLEDDPHFNAGRGAVFNADGGHELDASIMDGRDKSCGAVAGVRMVKNPISLARLVMTETRHVLLAGPGADRFAKEMNVEQVEQDYFTTPFQLERFQRKAKPPAKEQDKHMGTVGCVALDRRGNLAAGTSTGGVTNKKFGRVGDSPIVGAGTYADNNTCAVSCTGVGEYFIRHAIAHDVHARMAYLDASLEGAVRHVLHETLEPNTGGLIAVDKSGRIVLDFNTVGMSRAAADSTGRYEVQLGGK
ncbi:MAG: isoaspartyl peptidase/L-asparaginase [Planctomycetes bacterium]|nr:isoaspartyl peptidase/L-asparaginase [Planctomycetota bacterium]